VVAVLVTLSNIGVNITAAIASLSIGGLAIGLAAQDTLANLFGAVAVFMDKPFRIGDRIKLDIVDGTVEAIGMRSTRVRTLDGFLASIPNKTVGNATIINIAGRPTIKTEMNIGVTYDTSPEKLRRALAIIDEVYRSHPKTADLIVSFNRFADFALNILVLHWWGDTDPRACLAGLQEMNLSLKERFDAEGINFAYPTQTLYLKRAES
jgi:MscS family membrane protein